MFVEIFLCMLFWRIYGRRDVYFLNIYSIRVFYCFNRSRVLQLTCFALKMPFFWKNDRDTNFVIFMILLYLAGEVHMYTQLHLYVI